MGEAAFKLSQPLYRYMERIEDEAERMELARAAIAAPLQFFCPNGKQDEFIQVVANSTAHSKIPVILFTAANGVGKTTISMQILANIIYGTQNGWFDYPLYQAYPFPKLAWYITTRSAIENVLVKQMTEIFPPNSYTFDKRGKPYVSAVHFTNGWELVFFTQDQEVAQMESATVGLIIGDEPFTEDIWKALKSRRRMGCVTMLPMTPLDVEPFVVDEVEKFAREGRVGFFRIMASVYDACKVRGVRGHLDPDIIDEMVAGYSEEERQARAYGDFMYFSERIYPTLDAERHWVDPEDYPLRKDGTARVLNVVDPHDGRPCAVIWGQAQAIEHGQEYQKLIRMGKAKQQYRRIVFYETPLETNEPFWDMRMKRTLGEEVELWHTVETEVIKEELGVSTNTRVLDRHFGWQTRNSATVANTLLEEGRKRGASFVFKPSYDSKGEGTELAFGHNAVREMLQDLEDGKPGLVIWKNCWHTWNGLIHYIRKRAKNSDVTKAIGETKIVEKYKDFPDVVRYLVCEKIMFDVPDNGQETPRRSRESAACKNPVEALIRQL